MVPVFVSFSTVTVVDDSLDTSLLSGVNGSQYTGVDTPSSRGEKGARTEVVDSSFREIVAGGTPLYGPSLREGENTTKWGGLTPFCPSDLELC